MKMVLKLILLGPLLGCAAAAGAAAESAAGAGGGVADRGADPGPGRGSEENGDGRVWVERTRYLMGTVLRARVGAGEREVAVEGLERAFEAVERAESRLSSWRSDTEIGRLNAAPVGSWVELSDTAWAEVAEARRWWEATAGAFDPGVGALIDAWDQRGSGRVPTAAELEEALRATGLERFGFDDDRRAVVRRVEGAWLDTGAFGKGVGLRVAAEALRRAGVEAAYLDFGGQVLAYGGERREVAVAHPLRRGEPAFVLELLDGSVATTSQSERAVEVEGRRYGHVLDPRSGRPVPAWGSVTVIAEDPVTADALSTALFVLGPERGRAWAEGLEDVGVLFLEERDGELIPSWNAAFERHRVQRTSTY